MRFSVDVSDVRFNYWLSRKQVLGVEARADTVQLLCTINATVRTPPDDGLTVRRMVQSDAQLRYRVLVELCFSTDARRSGTPNSSALNLQASTSTSAPPSTMTSSRSRRVAAQLLTSASKWRASVDVASCCMWRDVFTSNTRAQTATRLSTPNNPSITCG